MHRRICWMVGVMLLFSTLTSVGLAASKQKFPVNPALNKGQKWRIAYYEGGPYPNYPENLKAVVLALGDLGWLQKIDIPDFADRNDSAKMWQWLAANVKSAYIQFIAEAFWSDNWDAALRKTNRATAIQRFSQKRDIDLLLAMGTWAGQDFANNEHAVATVVISASNPLSSNIIKRIDDSGFDHLNARVDPDRYQRQLTIFHDIFGFKKLGVVYDKETEAGKSYAGIDDAEKVAKTRGFEIISCHAPSADTSRREAKAAILKCYNEIAAKTDAVYVTAHRGVTLENLPGLLAPLNAKRIPTFSQQGSIEVSHGVLMSIAQAGFRYVARFHAETIAQIFNGAKPRGLPQLFEDPPRIALNLQTAVAIGYDPPIDILGAADEIYEEIAVTAATTD